MPIEVSLRGVPTLARQWFSLQKFIMLYFILRHFFSEMKTFKFAIVFFD